MTEKEAVLDLGPSTDSRWHRFKLVHRTDSTLNTKIEKDGSEDLKDSGLHQNWIKEMQRVK